jgi:hypothetical protein
MDSSRDYLESLNILKRQRVLLQSLATYENAVHRMASSGTVSLPDLNLANMKTETCTSIQKLWDERAHRTTRSV